MFYTLGAQFKFKLICLQYTTSLLNTLSVLLVSNLALEPVENFLKFSAEISLILSFKTYDS